MKSLLHNLFFLRLLSNFPKVMLVPFFAFWLINFQQLSAADASIIVGGYIITYRAGALFFSWLMVRRHPKSILIGNLATLLVLQTTLYTLSIYNSHYFLSWFITALLMGTSISIISNVILSYIGQLKQQRQHAAWFSYLNMAFNLSSGLGPVIGAYILHRYPHYLPLAPCLFVVIALLVSFYLPNATLSEQPLAKEKRNLNIRSQALLLKFITMSSLSLLGYASFYDLFPLYSHQFYSMPTISFLFLITCLIIVVFQIPVKKYLIEQTSQRWALFIANLLLAMAVLLLFFGGQGLMSWALAGVICLSFAEMIFLPIYQAHTLMLAGAGNGIYAMSLLSALWGLSEAIAASLGTYFIAHHQSLSFYMICTLLCALAAVYFLLTMRPTQSAAD